MSSPHPPSRRAVSSLAATLLLAGAVLLPGCAAAVGVVGDVGSGAVDTTQKVFNLGKVDAFVRAPWQDVITAAHQAAAHLALKSVREEPHPEQRKLVYTDDRKQEITITVIRRTADATEIRVDVGLFGPGGLAQLTLQEILRGLPAQGPKPTATNEKPK